MRLLGIGQSFVLLLCSAQIWAISLSQLVEIMYSNNISLHQLQNEKKLAEYDVQRAGSELWFPSGKLSTGVAFKNETSPVLPTAIVSVGKSFNLGGREFLSLQQKQLYLELAKRKEMRLRASLKKDLTIAYFLRLSLLAKVDAAQKSYQFASKKREQYQLLYSMGQISLSDLQQQQIAENDAFLTLQQQLQDLEKNTQEITTLMGQSLPEEEFIPTVEEANSFIKESSLVFSRTTNIFPLYERDETYLSLVYAFSNALLTLRMNKASLLPDAGISANYQISLTPSHPMRGELSYGISLSWDFLSWLPGSSVFYQKEQAYLEITNLQIQLATRKLALEQQLRLLSLQYATYQQNFAFAEEKLRDALLQQQKIQEQIKLGAASALDGLSAEAYTASVYEKYTTALSGLIQILCEKLFWYDQILP